MLLSSEPIADRAKLEREIDRGEVSISRCGKTLVGLVIKFSSNIGIHESSYKMQQRWYLTLQGVFHVRYANTHKPDKML